MLVFSEILCGQKPRFPCFYCNPRISAKELAPQTQNCIGRWWQQSLTMLHINSDQSEHTWAFFYALHAILVFAIRIVN